MLDYKRRMQTLEIVNKNIGVILQLFNNISMSKKWVALSILETRFSVYCFQIAIYVVKPSIIFVGDLKITEYRILHGLGPLLSHADSV